MDKWAANMFEIVHAINQNVNVFQMGSEDGDTIPCKDVPNLLAAFKENGYNVIAAGCGYEIESADRAKGIWISTEPPDDNDDVLFIGFYNESFHNKT